MARRMRGSMPASAAETSAARTVTVPISVPSYVTLPPNNSVSSRAAPPTVAAESSRNGSTRSGEPALRNNGSESSRKHGTFRYHSRNTGCTNSDSSAYTAPSSDKSSVGSRRMRTPSHAAVSAKTQPFISALSKRNGSIAIFMQRE